jgi:hypothetical protein
MPGSEGRGTMISTRLFRFVCMTFAAISLVGLWSNAQTGSGQSLRAGRNVNMVSGTTLPGGDPWLQRQNEPTLAVSTRNPRHIMAAANDYRTVDYPSTEPGGQGIPANATVGDAWLGVYKSLDGGASWSSTLLPGFPQDTSTEGNNSPLKQYATAADPTMRAGTNGLFYFSGIAFDRSSPQLSGIFLARYIDNNNSESSDPIKYLGTNVIDKGQPGRFIDMPSIAIDVPRSTKMVVIDGQQIPASNVYMVYPVFTGQSAVNVHGALYFMKSTDCGATWGKPIKLSEGTHVLQGAKIAIDSKSGVVYVAWRRFAAGSQKDAIEWTKSSDFGSTFAPSAALSAIDPFDQNSAAVTPPAAGFRTTTHPTIVVDSLGYAHCAWSQNHRGPLANESKIVMSNFNGTTWSAPAPVDIDISRVAGHQFMPVLTFAAGKLALVWYDQRNTAAQNVQVNAITDDPTSTTVINRQTLDVFAAYADPGPNPVFQTPFQVSRYAWMLQENTDGTITPKQAQYNPPDYPLFAGGTTPFIGDYFDIAPSPAFVMDANGKWQFNTSELNAPAFQVSWADNRDVRPPDDGDWTKYNPPNSAQLAGYSTGVTCQDRARTGMRNQNIYTSQLSRETTAGAFFNNKTLLKLGNFGNSTDGMPIPRTFVVYVRNDSGQTRSYRLRIMAKPPGGKASFNEFAQVDSLDVAIGANSTIARTVFAVSTTATDRAQVGVYEVVAGVEYPKNTIILNQDSTTPPISGDLFSQETTNVTITNPTITDPTNPNIVNPNIVNWGVVNPNIVNPNIVNPNIVNPNIVNADIVNPNIVNPNIVNPNIVNPNIVNPNIVNPNIVNPNIVNPNIVNPNIVNRPVTDATWIVTNTGNTTATYKTKLFSKEQLPVGVYTQVLIYKQTYTPATSPDSCDLKLVPHDEVLLNVTNPNIVNPNIVNPNIVNPNIVNPNIVNPNIVNPNIVNLALEDSTFSVGPGEKVFVTVRVIPDDKTQVISATQNFTQNVAVTAVSQTVNTSNAQAGIVTPPTAATKLIIGTGALADGFAGTGYQATLTAVGGAPTYTWSLNSGELPPGLAFSSQGQITGTIPAGTQGTFSFIVRVDDAGQGDSHQFDTQRYSIYVNPGATPTPLVSITAASPLPNAVQNFWYGTALESTGGTWPRTWSIESGSLPAGLTLDSGGTISGTPNVTGVLPATFTFTARVADSSSPQKWANKLFSITVNPGQSGVTYTISGIVRNTAGSPLSDVILRGLPNTPITDATGFYADTVPSGWSGTVTPFRTGYSFSPISRTYGSVSSDRSSQDYNEQYTLTVSKTGNGNGTLTSNPTGVNCGTTCSAGYNHGASVILTATASTGSTFTGWSGACSGTGTCTVQMDTAKNITANFALQNYQTLTITREGTGSGTLASSPAGINCGSTCTAAFNQAATVTLTATPASGSSFTGWSGACSGTGTCTLSMSAERLVTATFTLQIPTYALTIAKYGNGIGTLISSPAGIDCGLTCTTTFTYGTSVTLTPTPASGSNFTGWSGACTGTGTCTVSMTAARSVTATFTLQSSLTNTLLVSKTGNGSGTVASSPAGINCDPTCSASFNYGVSVTLTATSAAGSDFIGWGGPCTGTGTCTVVMDSTKSVTATFLPQPETLTVSRTGNGNGVVSSSPAGIDCGTTCSTSFDYGSSIILTVTPSIGSSFAGWSGACTGIGTCTASMTAARSVSATFTQVAQPVATLEFIAQPSAATAGQTMSLVQVVARDSRDNPVSGATVTLTVGTSACSSASLSGGLTAVTDSIGRASFTNLLLDKGGWGYTLVASTSSPMVTAVSSGVDVAGFCTTGSMSGIGYAHAAALLPNGKVLVAGGAVGVPPSAVTLQSNARLYDPATGSFSSTGSMARGRYTYTATLLNNGKVLVAGGSGENSAELYDPVTGTFTPTGSMVNVRYFHTATLLNNGKVLVTGGYDTAPTMLASAEIYDPATGSWALTGSMANVRYAHTATLLTSGKVLVAGGSPDGVNGQIGAEIYDPATGTWSPTTNPMTTARCFHTATLLPNGKVLVAGSYDSSVLYITSAELFDPETGTWSSTGSMAYPRNGHTATLLPNGKVLVEGRANSPLLESAELYDPATGTWSVTGTMAYHRAGQTSTLLPSGQLLIVGGQPDWSGAIVEVAEIYYPDHPGFSVTGSMSAARYLQTATLLPNGKVLAAGGWMGGSTSVSSSAELYDQSAGGGIWSPTGSMAAARFGHIATLLPNGKVLVAGGAGGAILSSAELYDPGTGSWSSTGSMTIARWIHADTLLTDGKVLVAGGCGVPSFSATPSLASVELYDTATATWTSTGSMADPRCWHTAIRLQNGKILVAGGSPDSGVTSLSSAEIYDPATRTWSPTGSMAQARFAHTATLLPNGRVLVSGGRNGPLYLASAEIYDPDTGTWSITGSMADARLTHSATLLPSGKVLVAGGGNAIISSAELYDPASGSWTKSGSMTKTRTKPTATLLPNGNVLIAGGIVQVWTGFNFLLVTSNTEVYFSVAPPFRNPGFSATGTMSGPRGAQTATRLANGKVLLVGGSAGSGPVASGDLYNPATGTWNLTGSMTTVRYAHSTTLLPNGKVLVAGGGPDYVADNYLSSAELYDPATGAFAATGAMQKVHKWHTATLLPNGKVLVAGGNRSWDPRPSGAELYDPATGTWSWTGSMVSPHSMHTATLLPNGKVLVVGGSDLSNIVATAELYDPATGTWSWTGSMTQRRANHTATLLPNGKVLVVGGTPDWDITNLSSAELYDPATGTWSPAGSMAYARTYHTATLLPNGRVLVTGGGNYAGGVGPLFYKLPSAELYDPEAGTWSPTGSMADTRWGHSATLLPNGRVLVAGGGNISALLTSAELYSPVDPPFQNPGFTATAGMSVARFQHTANLLPNGKILVSGGYTGSATVAGAELYNPASRAWSATGSLTTARSYHRSTLLPNGKILVAGGWTGSSAISTAELYDPATGNWTPTGSMTTARWSPSITLLPNGKVLVAGGRIDSTTVISSAELYDPATGAWTPTGFMNSAREWHAATLLPNGKVLVVGGGAPATLSSAELYDPATGIWTPTGSMGTARFALTLTLLPNGMVFAAGGGADPSAELYNPDTGTWIPTGLMAYPRNGHSATLLPNGKVLISGGFGFNNNAVIASSEIYDPAAGTWSDAGPMTSVRWLHSAILLPDGSVLIEGGGSGFGSAFVSAEQYSPGK